MLRKLSLCLLLFSSNVLAAQHYFPIVPNSKMTPGAYCRPGQPDFQGLRYAQRIPSCRRNVSHELKDAVYNAYGIPPRCRNNYTVDHFIPLSIGGNNQFENLWPEHALVKRSRMQFETEIHVAVSEGKMNQQQAIQLVYKVKLNPSMNPNTAVENCN
jgi:hypothetical protein